VLTTAEKKRQLRLEHQGLATEVMCRLNTLGVDFAHVVGIKAMTDITGFGLLGHLIEVCQKVTGYRPLYRSNRCLGCRGRGLHR